MVTTAGVGQRGDMSSSDYWTADTAQTYDESSANMFEPEVLDHVLQGG